MVSTLSCPGSFVLRANLTLLTCSRYRAAPHLLAAQPLNDLLTFIIVFLSTPYLRNPYLKGQFVTILYYNTRRNRDNSVGALGDAINTNPLALRSLMPALMRIYVG